MKIHGNQTTKSGRKIPQWIFRLCAVCLALLTWEVLARLIGQKLLLCSPLDVLIRLGSLWREPAFFPTLWYSFSRIVSGFLLAFAAGIVLGTLAGCCRPVEILLRPYMVTIKSVPVASFVVLALVWLTSARLSVFISFLMVLPVIYSGVLAGLKDRDPAAEEMADVFRLPTRRRLLYVAVPRVKPHLLSAAGLALGLAWKAGVAAELIGIPGGSIGEALYQAKVYLDTQELFAWTVVIVLISVLFEKVWMLLLRGVFAAVERLAGGGV